MRRWVVIILLLLITSLLTKHVEAQAYSSNVASVYEVEGNVEDGNLICSTSDGLKACVAVADSGLFGVVVTNPAALIDNTKIEKAVPIVTNGLVKVHVATINGPIAKGQYVTSSSLPGVAQVATENGYVLGTAMENYSNQNPTEVGEISVALNIHLEAGLSNSRSNLIAVLQQSRKAPVFAPLDSLRYLVAALLVVVSFVMGFIYFGRTTAVGVQAIGRNPLAKRQIQGSMILHFIVTFIVIGIGMFSAYLILIL